MPDELLNYIPWLSLASVRRSLHVGSLAYHDNVKVAQYLLNDLMQSVKPQLTQTMNHYKVSVVAKAVWLCNGYDVGLVTKRSWVRLLVWSLSSGYYLDEPFLGGT